MVNAAPTPEPAPPAESAPIPARIPPARNGRLVRLTIALVLAAHLAWIIRDWHAHTVGAAIFFTIVHGIYLAILWLSYGRESRAYWPTHTTIWATTAALLPLLVMIAIRLHSTEWGYGRTDENLLLLAAVVNFVLLVTAFTPWLANLPPHFKFGEPAFAQPIAPGVNSTFAEPIPYPQRFFPRFSTLFMFALGAAFLGLIALVNTVILHPILG